MQKEYTLVYKSLSISILSSGKMLTVCVKDLPKNLREKGWGENDMLIGLSNNASFEFLLSSTDSTAYAVVPVIKGVNPLTGLKGFSYLEQYPRGTQCPLGHGILSNGGHCPVCNHTWPSVNYLSVSNFTTLKGWQTGVKEVRPFLALQDESKDAAVALNGGDHSDVRFAVYTSLKKKIDILGWPSYPPGVRSVPCDHLFPPTYPTGRPSYPPGVRSVPCDHLFPPTYPTGVMYYSSNTHEDLNGSSAEAPRPISIGAGNPVPHSLGGASLDLCDLPDEPDTTLVAHPIPYNILEKLLESITADKPSGPFSNLP